jgi:hypothetical protein
MAQDWDDREEKEWEQRKNQEMNELINVLEELGIDFKVENDNIMIKGDVVYAEIFSLPGITIAQGDNRIDFDRLDKINGFNNIVVKTPTDVKKVTVSAGVHAYYNYPYLVIVF